MKPFLSSLVILALVGCGSNDTSDPNNPPASGGSIVGTWVNLVDPNTAMQMAFTSTTWKAEVVYLLTTGAYGLEINSGTYSTSGNTITLTKTASSCEGITTLTKVTADTFSRQGNSLTLTSGDGLHVALFQLSTSPPAGMGIATIGCVNASNNFIAHPVTTVP